MAKQKCVLINWCGIYLFDTVADGRYLSQLLYCKRQHLQLQSFWETSLVSDIRYATHIRSSEETARAICGEGIAMPLTWLTSDVLLVTTFDDPDHVEPADDPLMTSQGDDILAADDLLITDYIDNDSDDDADVAPHAQPPSPHVRFEPTLVRGDATIFTTVLIYSHLMSYRESSAQTTGQIY